MFLSIHNNAISEGDILYHYKGKWYTEYEYFRLLKKKRMIKDIICCSVITIIAIIRMVVYVKYGI